MEVDDILNAYIDLNLLLAIGAALWLSLRWALARAGLGFAYRPQLRLLNGLTALLAICPVLALGLTSWGGPAPTTLSDILVAQYLSGNVSMSAGEFETLIGLRETAVRAFLNQQGIVAQTLAAILALGMFYCVVRVAISAMRLRLIVRQAYPWKQAGRVHVLVSDVTRVAFSTRGLRRRYVVLPISLLTSPVDLRLTVSHELQHFRQNDIEFEFLLEFLRPLLFWNPAYHVWRREMQQLREYACDQTLLTRAHFNVRAYCECLMRASAFAARERVLFAERLPIVPLVDRTEVRGGSALKRRILAVASATGRQGHAVSWMGVSVAMMICVFAATIAIQRPSDWSHDRIMLATVVNLERMQQRSAQALSPFQTAQAQLD